MFSSMPYRTDIPGFMNIEELQTLEKWAKEIPQQGIIVEIGSFMGRTSWTLAQSCHPTVQVYCVDPWPLYRISDTMKQVMDDYREPYNYCFETFQHNTNECHNLSPLRGKSHEVPWPSDKKIDLVFIDARHQSPHVEQDLATWLPRLKPGGILAGHDYIPERYPDVCRAVRDICLELKTYPNFYEDSLWQIQVPL